jgi:hypothetical protein
MEYTFPSWASYLVNGPLNTAAYILCLLSTSQ